MMMKHGCDGHAGAGDTKRSVRLGCSISRVWSAKKAEDVCRRTVYTGSRMMTQLAISSAQRFYLRI
jgi:hypothetical protein